MLGVHLDYTNFTCVGLQLLGERVVLPIIGMNGEYYLNLPENEHVIISGSFSQGRQDVVHTMVLLQIWMQTASQFQVATDLEAKSVKILLTSHLL